MDSKDNKRLVKELIYQLETKNELTYEKKVSNEIKYENLDTFEIVSLLEEKKEQLRIAVEGLEKYKDDVFVSWFNYLVLIIGLFTSISAIILPLYNGLSNEFFSYLISIGIILLFVFGYLLVDRKISFNRKISRIQFKNVKVIEAKSLILHVENVIRQYSLTENKQF